MTKLRIARLCAIAGLVVGGGLLLIDVIGDGIYTCHPDPYFPSYQTCSWQDDAMAVVLIGPWLVATSLLARREALVPFACWFLGLMWWLGVVAAAILVPFVLPSVYPPPRAADEWVSIFGFALLGAMFATVVIGLLTALVGTVMQGVIRTRRRKRLLKTA